MLGSAEITRNGLEQKMKGMDEYDKVHSQDFNTESKKKTLDARGFIKDLPKMVNITAYPENTLFIA